MSSRSASEIVRPAVTAGWVVCGAMLLSSASVRWVDSGPGSRFGGLELADNIRSGVLSPSWGVWVALALYSIVGFGGVFIATATVDHLAVVAIRGLVAVLGVVVFALIALTAIPAGDWGPGSTLAALSFLGASALTVVHIVLRSGKRT